MTDRRLALLLLTLAVSLITVESQQAQEAPPPQAQVPANPLTDMLKRVFGGKPGAVPQTDEAAGDAETGDQKRAASSRDARLLAQAEQAAGSNDWQTTVQVLQSILDRPQDSIWRGADGLARSLQSEVEGRIGRLPPPGRQMYETEFGPVAAQLLEQTTQRDPLGASALVANRYFHTEAGQRAVARVASLLFDRGEYRAASDWYSRMQARTPAIDGIDWRARATYALLQIGERTQAEPLLDLLKNEPARNLIAAPGSNDTLDAWILNRPTEPARTPVLSDWRTLYGTPAHVGAAPPCEPLLLRRWDQPLTARLALQQQIQNLLFDLEDNQRAAIPTLLPIVVGDTIAFRTFRGLAVVDAPTGEMLWEGGPEVSAERVLANESGAEELDDSDDAGLLEEDDGTHFEHLRLTSLLFRDAGYGLLSSDGRRVFSIENSVLMPPSSFGYWWGNNSPSSQDPYHRDWSSNQIHAWDLRSGERLWDAGGRRMGESFDSPLAGVFFFGPPVAEGDELFAVGERDSEISLFVLSASSGDLLWSQAIAVSGASLEQDLVRRLWTCTPAIDGGLVICPTTERTLVAVDRHTHRIAWVRQFVEDAGRVESANGSAVNSAQPLNERWAPSAPIVSAGVVVFSPPEQPDPNRQDPPRLLCLDVKTGAQRWERPKGNSLYVAGVFDGRVLLVGRDEVTALHLADGTVAWTLPISNLDGPPSGWGIAVGTQYLLPLRSGQLWTIDLAAGSLIRSTRVPGGTVGAPLGNLAVWQGMLLSLGPQGLTGFEQREQLQEQIAVRLAADPHDLWAAVRQAEVRAAAGDTASTLQILDQVEESPDGDGGLLERRRRLTFDALLSLTRSDLTGHAPEFERASRLAQGDDEQLEIERLAVDRHVAAGRWEAACDLCRRISQRFPNDRWIDDGPTSARLDVWLGGRLEDIANQAPPEAAERIAERIAAALAEASLQSAAVASLERIYGFHPAAREFVWRLIEDAVFRRDLAGAEVRLRRLIETEDRPTRGAALARLGELLLEHGQPADAAAAFVRLSDELGDVVLPSLETGAELARRQFVTGRLDRSVLAPPVVADWTRDELSVRHYRIINPDYSTPQSPIARRLDALFFRDHSVEFDSQSPVMIVRNRADDSPYWRVPLRTTDAEVYNQSAAVYGNGLQMFVLYRGMVHAVSLPDRTVRWSRPVAERSAGVYSRSVYEGDSWILQPAGGFAARAGIANWQPPTGMLALAASRYVACHGRSEFSVLDPLTGDVLWRRRSILPQTGVFGNAGLLFVIPQDADQAVALRASDGRPVAIPELASLIKNTVAVTAAGFVRVERKSRARVPGGAGAQWTIAAVDPLTRKAAWSREFTPRPRLTYVDDRHLFVIDETSGECSLLDIDSGQVQPLGTAPVQIVQQAAEMHAVADARQVYLLLNTADQANSYIQPPAIHVNGTIVALARDGSGIAWQQAVVNQNLLLPRFQESPLLVCLAYDHVHLSELEADYFNARLLAIDKGDGRFVVEDARATPNGNYFRIDLSRADRALDILSHNARVRIQSVRAAEAPQ